MKMRKISFPLYAAFVGGIYGVLQIHLMHLALNQPREPDSLLLYQLLISNGLWLLMFIPSLVRAHRNRKLLATARDSKR